MLVAKFRPLATGIRFSGNPQPPLCADHVDTKTRGLLSPSDSQSIVLIKVSIFDGNIFTSGLAPDSEDNMDLPTKLQMTKHIDKTTEMKCQLGLGLRLEHTCTQVETPYLRSVSSCANARRPTGKNTVVLERLFCRSEHLLYRVSRFPP